MPKEKNDWNYDRIGFMNYESSMTFPTPDAVNGLEDGTMTL